MNILVTLPTNDEHKKLLEKQAPQANFEYVVQSEVTQEQVKNADVIIGNVPPAYLKNADKLKFLQLNTAGADGFTTAIGEDVLLTNTTGSFGLAISEHMIGMVLMLMKRLHQYRDNQLKCVWHDEGNVKSIEGSKVLVLGLGDIGGEFARKMKALGAYTIGVRRKDTTKPDYMDEIHLQEDIDKLIPEADIIAMALPGTNETRKIMNKQRIDSMKKGAILINVGRGYAVDTDALADAVERGDILAGVDVTDPEPLPENHKLWKCENAIITPHISGFFHLQETHNRMVKISAENLSRFVNGKPLMNIVDRETGYRKL